MNEEETYIPDPDEILENYDDIYPKLFIIDTLNDFFSINYICIFRCEYPEGCDHQTINPPYCPEHMRHCCSVEVKQSSVIPHQKGLFAARSNLFQVVPPHPTTAFFSGQRICLYGRAQGSKLNPTSANLVDDQHIRDVYGNSVNTYAFATDQNKIYDCALVRYPGAYANDAEADRSKYQIPGWSNNAIINYNQGECWLEATKTIEYGEEIFVDYGHDYWQGQLKHNDTIKYAESSHVPSWFIQFYKETYFVDLMEDLWKI